MTKDVKAEKSKDVVDILLYLYSVVMALALTTAVSMTVAPGGEALNLLGISTSSWAIFGAFLATIVPFYHGASIHMLRTLKDNPATRKKGEVLVDFFALTLEAVIFYAMAKSISQLESFVLWFGVLLALDIVWVSFTYFKSQKEVGQAPKWWAILNGGMLLALILLWAWIRTNETQVYATLFALALTRSVADYWKCYSYYFPEEKKNKNIVSSGSAEDESSTES